MSDMMANLEEINRLIEMARDNFPSVRYNHKMLEFLVLQMEKLENVEKLVQRKKLRKLGEGGSSQWRNLFRVVERGELLIRRHAEPFDLQKFYKVATVEEGVKDLCGGLRNCVEELIADGWLPQGRLHIKYHLDEGRVKEDRTYMYWYLAYILDGKQSGLHLDEATRREWDSLKTDHEGRMERLLLIGDSERDKIHWGKPIGSGGNSQVFSAKWRDIDVAVKKLADSERHLSHEALASFFTEVEIQMGMNYPFVVRLYAVSRDGLMLMELATSNLAVVYQQEMSMSWSMKAKLLAQAAQGLEYVHDRGVVHRDVKSLNFLVFGSSAATYTVKVADFGLAYMKTETQSKTGRQLGSPLWMAPEVHEGKFHTFNSDVFSFGVVMFEVAAQMLPYRGATPEVLLGRKRRRRDPCVVPEDCPEALLKLMRICITPEPSDRPSMKEVATRLNEISRQCQEGESSTPAFGGYSEDKPVEKMDPLSDLGTRGSRAQRQGPVGSYSGPNAERQGPIGASSVSRAQSQQPVATSSASKWFSRFSKRRTDSTAQPPASPLARAPSPTQHREMDVSSGSHSYDVPDGFRSVHRFDLSSLYTNHDGTENQPSYMPPARDQRPPVPASGGRRPPYRGRDGYPMDPRDPNSREFHSRESPHSRDFREPTSREFNSRGTPHYSSPGHRSTFSDVSMSATTEEWIRSKENDLKRNPDDRRTLLHKAAEEGNIEAAEVLVYQCEHIDTIDKLGWTALHDAAREGRGEIARLILAAGANPSIQDIGGEAPLHLAAYHSHVDVVGLLLSHGANHSLKNNWGNTALHVACMRQNADVVSTLLIHGANPWSRNKNGKYPKSLGGASIEELFRGVSDSGRQSPSECRRQKGIMKIFGKSSR